MASIDEYRSLGGENPVLTLCKLSIQLQMQVMKGFALGRWLKKPLLLQQCHFIDLTESCNMNLQCQE